MIFVLEKDQGDRISSQGFRVVRNNTQEHDREDREESFVMWRRSCDSYGGTIPEFVMNVTGTFRDDAMLRQVTESVLISKIDERMLINSKSEWNYVRIPRTIVTL